MELIPVFILFLLASYISFYIPGNIIVQFLLKDPQQEDSWILSWCIGLAFFMLGNYLFSWINLPNLYLIAILGGILFAVWQRKKIQFFPKGKWNMWILAIIIVGSVVYTSFSATAGVITKSGEQFGGLNALDGIMHIAYIKSQILYFPPRHPEAANMLLRGYHYFYDFLLSRFSIFFHFSPEDLYFRFFPFLMSLLYGSSFYILIKKITKNELSQRFVLFFIFFGEGLAYFLHLIKSDFNPLTAQSIDLIFDPSMIVASALFAVSLAILPLVKKSIRYSLVVSLLIGILTQTKVYVGITAASILFLFVLYKGISATWKERGLLFVTLGLSGLLTIVTFFPNNLHAGALIFAPFNLYNQFMQQNFFAKLHWGELLAIYQTHHNILRLTQMVIEAAGLYWVINLGIRLVAIKEVYKVFSKEFWKSDYNFFLFFGILITFLIPSFFLQSPSPFDVMQFTWITILFLNIPAGVVLGNLIQKTNLMVKSLIILLLLILFLPYFFYLENLYLFSKGILLLSTEQLAVFQTVANTVPSSSYYVTLPDGSTSYTPQRKLVGDLLWSYVPVTTALTGKSTYFERNITPDKSLTNTNEQRIKRMFLLSYAIEQCDMKSIMRQLAIIHSKYLITYYPQICIATSSALLQKKETSTYSFYQFR